jgi:hypothetical protein
VAFEEPQVRVDIELGAHQSAVERPAVVADIGDAVEHEHRRQGQLRIARTEELAPTTRQQCIVVV